MSEIPDKFDHSVMEGICPPCLQLNPALGENFLSHIAMGSLDAISRRTGCPVCLLVMQMVQDVGTTSENETGTQLSRHGPLGITIIQRSMVVYISEYQFKAIGSLKVFPTPRWAKLMPSYLANILRFRLAQPRIPDHRVRSLSVRLIRSWLRRCELLHRNTCTAMTQASPMNQLNAMILVDVQKMRLLRTFSQHRYTALSYVWGGVQTLKTTKSTIKELEQNGALNRYKGELPTVICDSIELVRRIGERYIWIDALCIIQDDEDSKHTQILSMGKIYKNAVLTIAAMSIRGANESLPSVGYRQAYERVINLREFSVRSHTATSPTYLFAEAPYENRAWTLQERLLSQRCLYLMDKKVYFHCNRGLYDEKQPYTRVDSKDRFIERILNPLLVLKLPLTGSKYDYPTGTGFKNWWRGMRAYEDLVGMYTARELSYQSDRIHAFEGISAAIREACGGTFVVGLPESMIDVALLWVPASVDRSNDAIYSNMQRNPIFPSWSWAGWMGAADYTFRESGTSPLPRGFQSEISKFWVEDQFSLRPVPRNNLCFAPNTPQDEEAHPTILGVFLRTTTLHFWTQSVEANLFSIDEEQIEFPYESLGARIMDGRRQHCGILVHYNSDKSVVCFGLDFRFILLSSICQEEEDPFTRCHGKVIAFDEEHFRSSFDERNIVILMLIQCKGEYAERLAIAHVHKEAWDSANPIRQYIRLS